VRRRRNRRGNLDGPADLELLTSLNSLSQRLRAGLDASAPALAASVAELLDARSVAITDGDRWSAEAGQPLSWRNEVVANAETVLDRRRTDTPTVYETVVDSEQLEVIVSVIDSDDVPLGTIHVVPRPGDTLRIRELHDLTAFVSSQLQLAELERSRAHAAEAELQALRAQVSPHFLHNALTAIASLVMTDPVRARGLIAKFSQFLRATFRERTDLTSISDELRLVETYVELEQLRFGDRFDVTLNIAPEALPVRLPFLTVQPIVENAIRHGLESRPGAGQLHIEAYDAGPEIVIVVDDDGVGIDADALEQAMAAAGSTSHVGIRAVDTRLRSLFGQEYGLMVETGRDAGTKVTIRVPKSTVG